LLIQDREQTGDQVQTATADMWSLGMVALTLISMVTNEELQNLCQMDQSRLEQCIEIVTSKKDHLPSDDALSFVRDCLQLSPTKRLKTDDAAQHRWLCTPRKHAKFFRRLDEKMMEDFHVQSEIRAIPWELPDVECLGRLCPATVSWGPHIGGPV
jgi:serine/threonine protein kinase